MPHVSFVPKCVKSCFLYSLSISNCSWIMSLFPTKIDYHLGYKEVISICFALPVERPSGLNRPHMTVRPSILNQGRPSRPLVQILYSCQKGLKELLKFLFRKRGDKMRYILILMLITICLHTSFIICNLLYIHFIEGGCLIWREDIFYLEYMIIYLLKVSCFSS